MNEKNVIWVVAIIIVGGALLINACMNGCDELLAERLAQEKVLCGELYFKSREMIANGLEKIVCINALGEVTEKFIPVGEER